MVPKKRENIDLRSIHNPSCQKCENRDEKKEHLEGGLCTTAHAILDNLPARCVGEWAHDKIYRLTQYYGIFVLGMSKKWSGINYVEICSGPGRCIVKKAAEEIDGTAIAILRHNRSDKLSKAIFIDKDKRAIDILNKRICDLNLDHKAHAYIGDYDNTLGIVSIIDHLPKNCLNLVFVDPTDCSVPFQTVQSIYRTLNNADLLVNFAFGTDSKRNLAYSITQKEKYKKARDKYIRFLGGTAFFDDNESITLAQQGNHTQLNRAFVEAYKDNLRKDGYEYTDIRTVKHYYHLLFATRHKKGLEFWQEACTYDPSGQKQLF